MFAEVKGKLTFMENCVRKYLSALLLIIAQTGNHQDKQPWYIHTMKPYLAKKRDQLLICKTVSRMNLRCIHEGKEARS